jgi:hypothetical protein
MIDMMRMMMMMMRICWGGEGLVFLWIHINFEVLQAVSLLELSAVLRGVVSYSSEWPVATVICIFLGVFRSLWDVHTWRIKNTGCHVPAVIFSTVTDDGVPQTKPKRPVYIRLFYSPTDAQESCFKRNIKIYIKTAPTCFDLITISRERIIWAC